jgi:hypothetical protein
MECTLVHNSKQKPLRGVNLKIATEIKQIWGKVVEPGQGECSYSI